ncbi:sigma-54-dependent Fis family transcriptional regulator [Pseudothauera nasutitermitis]|uniref:Sigma-54-dependent Fis family transcriptional regulator n=2 Tax=Pseudothauera nasutitermitis TaxID=2565930 RepID=A0A4S4B4U8_9RHOO|nr:sigma-54-dependent Fis family transcriptional regulator [Pseudothauera nasutitermitis]
MTDDIPIRVLFVEDDPDVRLGCTQTLELAGFSVDAHASVEQARPHVAPGAPLVVLCDVQLPGTSGLQWQAELRGLDADLPVILVTGHGDIAMAVQAMRDGAYDFIEKPFPSDQLISTVRRAVDKRRLTLQVQALHHQLESWHGIQSALIGRSARMEQVRRTLLALADTSANVLIYGETGTGKELVARCLHDHSARRRNPFVPLNCGGLPENLAESELFGHEAGAFTGANKLRIGKFEYAQGGTLFLDEIESMPAAVQIKLLRALQERRIERIGSNKQVEVDCRVVAASKDDLKALSDRQAFRADLYYRLGVAFIDLPPLRERREDIPILLEHFILQAASLYQRPAPAPDAAQLARLMAHDWPGNVRELRNVADRLVLGLLDDTLGLGTAAGAPADTVGLARQVEEFEKTLIREALRRNQGDIAATAAELKLPKPTLYDKVRRWRLNAPPA